MFLSNENVYTEQHFAVSYRQQTIGNGNVPLNYDTTSLRLYTKIARDTSCSPEFSPLLHNENDSHIGAPIFVLTTSRGTLSD